MNDSVSCLTQSNFYSPAFNAAIFDGPIRLYFAQYQEASALRIYFRLQSELKESYLWAKNLHRSLGRHLFVMLYPSSDTFDLSFPGEVSRIFVEPVSVMTTLLAFAGPFLMTTFLVSMKKYLMSSNPGD